MPTCFRLCTAAGLPWKRRRTAAVESSSCVGGIKERIEKFLSLDFLFFFSLLMYFPQDLHFYLVAPEIFRCRLVCMQYDRRNQSRSLLLLLQWEGYLFGLFLLNWPRNVPDIYTDDVISQKTGVRSFLSPKQRGNFANEVEGSAALQ